MVISGRFWERLHLGNGTMSASFNSGAWLLANTSTGRSILEGWRRGYEQGERNCWTRLPPRRVGLQVGDHMVHWNRSKWVCRSLRWQDERCSCSKELYEQGWFQRHVLARGVAAAPGVVRRVSTLAFLVSHFVGSPSQKKEAIALYWSYRTRGVAGASEWKACSKCVGSPAWYTQRTRRS